MGERIKKKLRDADSVKRNNAGWEFGLWTDPDSFSTRDRFYFGRSGITDSDLVINKDGNVGIGTANLGAKLEVNGKVKITDGTQGDGKVLTSNAEGEASWVEGGRPTISGVFGATDGSFSSLGFWDFCALTMTFSQTRDSKWALVGCYVTKNNDGTWTLKADYSARAQISYFAICLKW